MSRRTLLSRRISLTCKRIRLLALRLHRTRSRAARARLHLAISSSRARARCATGNGDARRHWKGSQPADARLHRDVPGLSSRLLGNGGLLPPARWGARGGEPRSPDVRLRRDLSNERELHVTRIGPALPHLRRVRRGLPAMCRGLRANGRRQPHGRLRRRVPALRRVVPAHVGRWRRRRRRCADLNHFINIIKHAR